MPGALKWYAVHTQARAEAKARLHLERQGFLTYLPRYRKQRRHARRIDVVPAPLFPRYLFIAAADKQRWRAIQSTIGVSHLVCVGDRPAEVQDSVVVALQNLHDAEGFVVLETSPRFAPGEPVRVTGGAFANFIGLYEGLTDHQRVAILLDLLGRKVRMSIDLGFLEAA